MQTSEISDRKILAGFLAGFLLIAGVVTLTHYDKCVIGHYQKVWVEAYTIPAGFCVYADGRETCFPDTETVPAHWEEIWTCDKWEYGADNMHEKPFSVEVPEEDHHG